MVGGRFNTIIGLVFLAIVIVSPDGLTGLWDRIWDTARRRGGPPQVDVETREAAIGRARREVENERRLGVGSPLIQVRRFEVQASRRRNDEVQ